MLLWTLALTKAVLDVPKLGVRFSKRKQQLFEEEKTLFADVVEVAKGAQREVWNRKSEERRKQTHDQSETQITSNMAMEYIMKLGSYVLDQASFVQK